MAMGKCIDVIAKAADLSASDLRFVQEHLDKLRDDPAFKEKAQADAEELARQATLHAVNAKQQVLADFRFGQRLDNATQTIEKGKANWRDAGLSYLTGSRRAFKGARADTDTYAKASSVWAQNEVLANMAKIAGRQYAKLFKDGEFNRLVAKELGGEATDNKTAADMAGILRAAYQKAIKRANDAGAGIRELPNYIFAQHHDPYKLAKAGRQAWVDSVKPLLDHKTYSGENPDEFLAKVYDNILQGQHDTPWTKGDYRGKSGLAKRLGRQRVLHFKDADSFLKYDASFGKNGEVMTSAVNQVQRLTRQAALMERLGPNPETFFSHMVKTLKDASRGSDKPFTSADETKLRAHFDALMHHEKIASYTWAHNFAVARGLINLAHLGTSTVSSFGDINNMAMILHYNGMPMIESYGRAITAWGQHFAHPFHGPVKDIEQLQLLKSFASGFDGVNHSTAGRWNPMDDYSGTMARAQGAFFVMNGQSAWDDTVKLATSKAISTWFAQQADKSFAELPEATQRGLERYDITASDWDAMRKSEQVEINGQQHLVPDKMDETTGRKFSTYLLGNSEVSVPLPGAGQMAFLGKHYLTRGDPVQEIIRTMFMFKSFPVSLIAKMWPRAAEMGLPGWAMATVGGLPFGFAALTVKNLLEGKEPPDWRDPKTTLASFVQGGAASMAGDIIMHKFDATHSFADMAVGPLGATANDILEGVSAPLHGKKIGPSEVRAIARNVPFANLWFTKAAYNYLVVYQLQEALDPGYLQRMKTRAQQKYNEKFIIPPQ